MRELSTLRLESKRLLSAEAQCFHLRFAWAGTPPAQAAEPGQFFSFVAPAPDGKTYTRAYSVAGASTEAVEVCVNRVEGGFFSNLLCDLEPGAELGCHGPHGLFTLGAGEGPRLFVAEGTGVAPMRGFAQALYAGGRQARCTLLYWAAQAGELLYHDEWQALAGAGRGFAYVPVVSTGGYDELRERVRALAAPLSGEGAQAYVCGLAAMVKPVREELVLGLGWPKRQVLTERYD